MSKATWLTGAAVLACSGALVAYGAVGQASAAPRNTAALAAAVTKSAKSAKVTPVLSGKRQVTIVRVQAFESALSMSDEGRLVEADDDSGRQLFVPTPLGKGRYQIKAYATANGHPAADEPSCWQVYDANPSEPLSVTAAPCDADNSDQHFTITPHGKAYAIGTPQGEFLQHAAEFGLYVQHLGDAPLDDTYRFVDSGPARSAG